MAKKITVSLSDGMYRQLQKRAEGIGLSRLIRSILQAWLERQEADPVLIEDGAEEMIDLTDGM